METINQQRVRQRVSFVIDSQHAAQAPPGDVKKYVKGLQDSVGLKDDAGDAQDFMSDFGKGL